MAIEQERTEAAISELHCQTPTRLAYGETTSESTEDGASSDRRC